MIDPEMILRATAFAVKAHEGQCRKYTGEPYVLHCIEVARIVADIGDEEMVIAALLHDTVEDTDTAFEDIMEAFGADVCNLVYWLTETSKPSDGNRAARKAIDREHLARAPADAQTVKLADLISNTRSIVQHDPSFAVVYLKEKQQLLEVLTSGNPNLHRQASELVRDGLETLAKEGGEVHA